MSLFDIRMNIRTQFLTCTTSNYAYQNEIQKRPNKRREQTTWKTWVSARLEYNIKMDVKRSRV